MAFGLFSAVSGGSFLWLEMIPFSLSIFFSTSCSILYFSFEKTCKMFDFLAAFMRRRLAKISMVLKVAFLSIFLCPSAFFSA
ncbi:hypothetical protein K469DRAFT_133131 [Zopfia rhizophila CBS 207.26]|uniref:Uncharacterized protein n=1 Tax=Zopfia rhizophila CBS 207.26 TaxID=1314779 RepID=A0A6A6EUV5_9PEZI|nr:hypothetical protein K469DRAFT_133131 [Zopfia rhizophila CBS 207.26]